MSKIKRNAAVIDVAAVFSGRKACRRAGIFVVFSGCMNTVE
jgi:hypothetical protein